MEHLLEGKGLLGLFDLVFPGLLGFLESVDTSVKDLFGLNQGVHGSSPVLVSSDLEGFHLVGLSDGLLHGDVHHVVRDLGLLSDDEVLFVVLVGNADLGFPRDNEGLSLLELLLSSLLGLDRDEEEGVVLLHLFVGLVLGSDSDISGTSGSVSLGFPVSGELLSGSLLDLLLLGLNLHVVPHLLGVDGFLDSGDSGNLSSDEVHLGFSGELLLVDDDLVSFLFGGDADVELFSGELNGDLPLLVLISGGLLSGALGDLSLSSGLDLDVSLLDGLLGSSLGNLGSFAGDLGVLDFTEHSLVFHLGLTGGDTSEVGVSVGSLLGLDGKTDGSSSLGVSNASVLDGKLQLEFSNVSKLGLSLDLEESGDLGLNGGLEVSVGNGLEVGHVSHSILSSLSLLSGVSKSGNDISSSSEFLSVGSKVIFLVLSSSSVDVLELGSLGADESSLVEAVSVHPVRSADNSNTSGVSTSGAIGLSLTPVLELEALTVNPSVTLGGLAGTDPVSLDVRLDHLSDLVLLFLRKDRYEFTTPFAADTSGVVPGLLLFENLELSDNFVSDSLEVVGFSLGNSFSLSSSGSLLSFSSGVSGGSAGSSLLLLLGLDLGSSGSIGLSFLDLGESSSLSGVVLSFLLLSDSSFLGVVLLLLIKLLLVESSLSIGSLFDSSSSISGLLGSDLLIVGKFDSGSFSSLFSGSSLSSIGSVVVNFSDSSGLLSVSLSGLVNSDINLDDLSRLVGSTDSLNLSNVGLVGLIDFLDHGAGDGGGTIGSLSELISVGARLQGSSLRYSHC